MDFYGTLNTVLIIVFQKINEGFEWDSVEQGWILGSFFCGHVCSSLIGGYLADKISGKWVVGLGNLVSAFGTLLTPLAAKHSFSSLVVVRTTVGLGNVNYL